MPGMLPFLFLRLPSPRMFSHSEISLKYLYPRESYRSFSMSNHHLPWENNRQVSFHCPSAFSSKEILWMNSITVSFLLTATVASFDTIRVCQSVCLSLLLCFPSSLLPVFPFFLRPSFFLSPSLSVSFFQHASV